MGVQFSAETVSGVQQQVFTIEQRVAGAFKRQVSWQLADAKAVGLEENAKICFFGLSFPVKKGAEYHLLAEHQAGVSGKHHIRGPRSWRDQIHLGLLTEKSMEPVPLLGGQAGVRPIQVPFHPRIDDVLDLELIGRTHENAVGLIHKKPG